MWFDLITARTAQENINWLSSAVLVGLWKALQPEQQFRTAWLSHAYPSSMVRQSGCLPQPRL